MKKLSMLFAILTVFTLLLAACGGEAESSPEPQTGEGTVESTAEAQTEPPPSETPPPDPTDLPQPLAGPVSYGPDLGDFGFGVNPLTGLPVVDPALLDLPAVLISITNFPASARPQAGLSFAPLIFEIYIGEGTTRFLVVFYGEMPAVMAQLTGSCPVRVEHFDPAGTVLGNYAWLDVNANGTQEPDEPGIPGLCVSLYDTAGTLLQATATDSNGYYGFNVDPQGSYLIGFEVLEQLAFTSRDVGYDDLDSDADPASGMTAEISLSANDNNWDAGYVLLASGTTSGETTTPVSMPPSEVGPVRSGRLPYRHITSYFPGGCLVFASASANVLAQLPACSFAFGSDADNINSALLDVTRMRQLAEANRAPGQTFNYSGNLFDQDPPQGGLPASQVQVLWSNANQALFRYDALSGAYLRFENHPNTPQEFSPSTDRLTGRQLAFENVIFVFAVHNAVSETLIDINIGQGNLGRAYLLRDGQLFPIHWTTLNAAYETETGLLRPIRFTDDAGDPVALKPGHTWVHVFTPGSALFERDPGSGLWTADFNAPAIQQ